MHCSECGNQMPDGAKFCGACGAPTKSGVAGAEGGAPGGIPAGPAGIPPPRPPSGSGGSAAGPGGAGPGGSSSAVMWVAIAAVAAVIIAIAIAVPLIILHGGDTDTTTTTTEVTGSTTTTASATTTSEPPTSTTSEPTTSTTAATTPAPPGDSAGAWVEQQIPGVPTETYDIAISDEAFAYIKYSGDDPKLSVYLFEEDETIEIPVDAMLAGMPDLDGRLLVWREANYDADNEITDAHIYAYRLPGGPKVEVASDSRAGYPQVAAGVVTWALAETWTESPDEFVLVRIIAAAVDQDGRPTDASGELVSAALASIMGDSSWSYSLSPTHLSWETHEAIDAYDPGTYVLDFDSMQPSIVSPLGFNGSIGGDTLVFRESGGTEVKTADLLSGQIDTLDTRGEYPKAGPTYAAYFRATDGGDWQVVARGFTGSYEQTLLNSTGEAPWMLPSIAASPNRIAFVVGGKVRAFVWQAD